MLDSVQTYSETDSDYVNCETGSGRKIDIDDRAETSVCCCHIQAGLGPCCESVLTENETALDAGY